MPRSLAPRTLRLARVLLALLLGLALTEGVLRLCGLAYLAVASRRVEQGGERAGTLVVCLGDSNVFGIFGDADESYPAQLERLLVERGAGRAGGAQVLNLGVPGASTLHVVRDLGAVIDRWRPDAVLVSAGVNNAWTWVGGDGDDPGSPPWYAELRLAKLVRLLRQDLGPDLGGGAAPGLSKGSPLNETERLRSIRRDLERLQTIADGRSTPLLFVAYAANERGYAEANRVLRAFARERGAALADPSEAVASLQERLGKQALFHPDLHPRTPCYTLVARVAYNELVARGLIAGERIERPAEGIAASATATVQITVSGDAELPDGSDGGLSLSIAGGRPATPFRVVAYGFHRSGEIEPPPFVEARGDPLCRALRGRGLHGRLDLEGRAHVPLPASAFPVAPDELHGAHFFCTVFFEPAAEGERPAPPVGPVRARIP